LEKNTRLYSAITL